MPIKPWEVGNFRIQRCLLWQSSGWKKQHWGDPATLRCSFVNSWTFSDPLGKDQSYPGRWESRAFLRLVDFVTNICKWILNGAMKSSEFQNIFITKPEKNHLPPLPPSPQKDHRRFILRSDERFTRSEVDYDESLLIWILYLSSRLTQFVMVSFSLKKKTSELSGTQSSKTKFSPDTKQYFQKTKTKT